jgi:hypothetical protein
MSRNLAVTTITTTVMVPAIPVHIIRADLSSETAQSHPHYHHSTIIVLFFIVVFIICSYKFCELAP